MLPQKFFKSICHLAQAPISNITNALFADSTFSPRATPSTTTQTSDGVSRRAASLGRSMSAAPRIPYSSATTANLQYVLTTSGHGTRERHAKSTTTESRDGSNVIKPLKTRRVWPRLVDRAKSVPAAIVLGTFRRVTGATT
jgi:hypothetical protein